MKSDFIYHSKILVRNPLYPLLEKSLIRIKSNNYFIDSIFTASHAIYKQLMSSTKEDNTKLSQSLLKYHIRACTRCTPYGLFAGLHVAEISDKPTEIRISSVPRPKLRLDMDYLVNVYHDVCKDADLLIYLKYYPNSSLFKIGQKWRYHELRFINQRAVFHLVSIEDNIVISELIRKSSNGISYQQAIDCITSFGFEFEDAQPFLLTLIQSQVFINELYPNVSGLEYQTRLFTKLAQYAKYQHLPYQIDEVLNGKGTIMQKTASIKGVLTTYFNTAINESKFIQVDTWKTAYQANISHAIVKHILEAAELLHRLSAFDDSQSLLQKFKLAFYERYEEAEVPLLALLDTDIGIHYKNAANEIDIRNTNRNNVLWDVHAKFRMDLYVKFQREQLHEIVLMDEDLKSFVLPKDTLPDTMSFMGELLQEGIETKIIWGGMSNNATVLLGRFGHLDPTVEALCKEITKQEEALQPDKIFAEIVHISEGRLGNILTRPHYRNYEIPYLAFSTLPDTQQIQMNDLWVSIRNGRLVLRSKRLNKEILPRMANAHNYAGFGLPIYHFLCDLQHQGIKGHLGWSWHFLGGEPYLPRVTYKNVILSPAYWNLPSAKLKELQKLPPKERVLQIEKLKKVYQLPNEVFLSEGDNELLLDLSNELCIDILIDTAKKYSNIRLTECLFNKDNLLVKDEQGRGYTNEIIIPFVRKSVVKATKQEIIVKPQFQNKIKRRFDPSSEWVYFKLYTGTKAADAILTNELNKVINKLEKNQLIMKWFFIRYHDPKSHLRVRFLLSDKQNFNELYQAIRNAFSSLVQTGTIWKIQTDTYDRELERYGWASIELSESVFHLNSSLTLELLSFAAKEAHQGHRFLIGLFGVMHLFDVFGYDTKERMLLIEQGSKQFAKEFGLSNNLGLRERIKEDYRKYSQGILQWEEEALNNSLIDENLSKKIRLIFRNHIKKITPVVEELKITRFAKPMDELLPSYVHMFVNRFFHASQRFEEMMIYQLLQKYYSSKIAREKYASKVS